MPCAAIARYSRKWFLQRLIANIPFVANHIERMRAYDSHNPSNRIYNNILQITRHPDAQGMDGGERGNLCLLNEKLLEYASSLIHFGICYGSIDQDLQTLSQLCL